ncbi:MAG: GDSL-type esterase/lipase family protein [Ferruginibacter sp.]
MGIKYKWVYPLVAILFNVGYAQPIPLVQNPAGISTPHINYLANRISNAPALNDFFFKLNDLKKYGNRLVRIVHIGDSHIQADFLSGYVRNSLQAFFGNAGRGLVFPYQVARSNAPSDIHSRSATGWKFNRLAHPEIPIAPGVSGYVIETNQLSINLEMSLSNSANDSAGYFKRLKFFIDSNKFSSWILTAGNNNKSYFINNNDSATGTYHEVALDNYADNFSLAAIPTSTLKSFYGVSLENDRPGILYHATGVNGARYDHFNKANLYWQQLGDLLADLYIISLGTNEAQGTSFSEDQFRNEIDLMLSHIKSISPGAAILITTAPDSFKGRKPNSILQQINIALVKYCTANQIPLWDLYGVTNGYGSSYNWSSRGLMSKDRIHFTADGYRLQGQLLFNALARAYNDFIQH